MLEQTLKQLIGNYRPESLIVAGDTASRVGRIWAEHAGARLVELSARPVEEWPRQAEVADLALVTELLGTLAHEEARQLLGWLRNAGARRVAVSVHPDDDWSFNDMIGLAFRRHATLDDGTELFTYDIATYNRPREWNNPRFWANPENWGKYRW
ncbi:hypothetical protein EZI54_00425 [Marinobacter halodurans]|uniref:DUF4123 domain-containing protein n=1 Tax=Marinobacter halodurans TaxID=2528979 RepID=A0ABY1ZT72_9GAMM|nr:DUF6231 family protein [Marinobacter halodurans]TBW59459.1 hypothetical protein EZI54_00425 [Marinobacter halodurans]